MLYVFFLFLSFYFLCVFILALYFPFLWAIFRFVSVLVFFSFVSLVLQIEQNRCTSSFSYENVICKARAMVVGSVKEKAETFYVKLTNQPKHSLLTITSKSMLETWHFNGSQRILIEARFFTAQVNQPDTQSTSFVRIRISTST